MAHFEQIQTTTARITERLLDMDLRGLPADLDILTRQLGAFVEQQDEALAAARSQLNLAGARNDSLAEELDRSRKFTKHLLTHRRILETAKNEAVKRSALIQAQAEHLWSALQPQWRPVEEELTCHICFYKLWSAVSLIPCSHIVCAGCAYHWFKSRHGKEALTCVSCSLVVTGRSLRAHLVEQAVRKLLTVNEEECTDREEVNRKRGYEGDASWDDFF